jgi:hypothetical protein
LAKIRGPGYEIIVEGSGGFPKWDPLRAKLYVSKQLLEADAKFGMLGERIAGLLLPPLDYDEELENLIDSYRLRISAEQAADLQYRIGRLASLVRIRPSFLPLSRARILWNDLGCLLKNGLDPDKLDEEYHHYGSRIGVLENGLIALKPRKYREVLQVISSQWRLRAASLLTGITRRLSVELHICSTVPEALDPSRLVIAPEGDYYYECTKPTVLAMRYT